MSLNRKIPIPADIKDPIEQFRSFIELVKILREDCPWDRKQTHESISHLLIEEVYETLDAVKKSDDQEFSKELGDVLLHIVMHCVMAEERGAFSMTDVISKIAAKLVYRHPHVFGDVKVNDDVDVKKNWEMLKMKDGRISILDGVPQALPALLRAQRIQEKVSNVGFDWEDARDVWNKVEEEINELRIEILAGNTKNAEAEFGDVLFALVNAARFEKIVAENALQLTNDKFLRRFQFIEKKAAEIGNNLADMTLAEMDALWDESKKA